MRIVLTFLPPEGTITIQINKKKRKTVTKAPTPTEKSKKHKDNSLGLKFMDLDAIWKAERQVDKWTNRQDNSFYLGHGNHVA